MDRDFRTPQDVARASPDRVEQSLAKELRRGVDAKPFVLRLRFQYDGGRAAPMLYVGALNRSWRDYINANARATDMITGICTSGRGSVGRQLLTLDVRGGRGATDGNLNELNRSTRRLNLEVVYVEANGVDAASGSVVASDSASAEESNDVAAAGAVTPSLAESAPTPTPAPPLPDLLVEAKALKRQFEAFKVAPTADGLASMQAAVRAWRAGLERAPEMQGTEAELFVNKLGTLLETKGKQFIAQHSG